jgi:uncharacterized protein YqfB (UPF0267 family)
MNYVFTFETDEQLFEAERTGYIDIYDIVRICRRVNEFETVDYPCKSREQFDWHLNEYKDSIEEIYPDRHCYDVCDYL